MRAKIKTSNITYFLRQEFGFSSLKQFFEQTQYHPSLKNKVIHKMVNEFTGYRIENNKLVTYNPYTDKNEVLNMKSFGHISSKEDLLKDLSLLHKTRMEMLEQSRKRILELSKEAKKTRDNDLMIKHERAVATRQQELSRHKNSNERELER